MNVEDLYRDKNYKNITEAILKKNGLNVNLCSDIVSDIALVLLEHEQSGQINLSTVNKPYNFYYGYCKNIILSYTTRKKYSYNENNIVITSTDIVNTLSFPNEEAQNFDAERLKKINDYLRPSEKDNWRQSLSKKIFELYLKEPSYRKLSKKTGVPISLISAEVSKIKSILQKLK